MLITCPSCASSYDIPSDRIGAAGRKVRCASCRDSWFVASPSEEAAVASPSLEGEGEAVVIVARPVQPPVEAADEALPGGGKGRRTTKRAAKPKRPSVLPKLGRAAAVVALCASLPALLGFREKVVASVPGTASLYRVVGLPVNLVGLAFADVTSSLSTESGTPVLEVTGQIVNDGRQPRTVPWLRIALEDAGGGQLYGWSTKAAEGELAVGARAPFRVRLTAPPPGARKVEVSFRLEADRLATE